MVTSVAKILHVLIARIINGVEKRILCTVEFEGFDIGFFAKRKVKSRGAFDPLVVDEEPCVAMKCKNIGFHHLF